MMNSKLNRLERAVLVKLLAGEHPVVEALREQLLVCGVKKREMTGHGFFTELKVDDSMLPAPTAEKNLRLGDVEAEIKGLENGAGFVLFVRDGYLDMLEGYSYEEPWPKSSDEFTLAYSQGARDLTILQVSLGSDRGD